jgi:DNA-binding MurR/RpiR family transcriptional regulator
MGTMDGADQGAWTAEAADRGGDGGEAGAGAGGAAAARLTKLFEDRRLTPTQRRIAHCLVRRVDDAPFLSSVEVAELAGVSQPSVTRFAVALGFDGYPALRRHLREVAPGGQPGADREAAEGNEYQQAVRAEIENLRHLADLLADPAPVARAGALLAASRPLPVLGLRAAGAQARGFAYFAAKVHPDVRLLDEGGTLLVDRIDGAVRAGASALLCFALPRHPREVAEALAHAREAGLTVVTVADSSFAPVAAHSDLLLPAAVGIGLAFDTACAPMMLGRVLLEAMCDELPQAQARLEEFDARAVARGLFLD